MKKREAEQADTWVLEPIFVADRALVTERVMSGAEAERVFASLRAEGVMVRRPIHLRDANRLDNGERKPPAPKRVRNGVR